MFRSDSKRHASDAEYEQELHRESSSALLEATFGKILAALPRDVENPLGEQLSSRRFVSYRHGGVTGQFRQNREESKEM
jgi:hypothetical protein